MKNRERKSNMEDIDVDGRTILKLILQQYDGIAWKNGNGTFGSLKMLGISSLAEKLASFQDGLRNTKIDNNK